MVIYWTNLNGQREHRRGKSDAIIENVDETGKSNR
jgi:hypothetical protein